MTFDDLRSFACGELGWTTERFRHSTLTDYNIACEGYWRNWERQTAWLMREVVFAMIAGNPHIKPDGKPRSAREIMKLSDDTSNEKQKEARAEIKAEEIEEVKRLFNGTTE